MEHRAYRNILPDAKTAVLFIHGINGTPNHFRDLVKLIPEGCSVVNLLLKGHGKGVSDFAKASMKEWKAQVDAEVESLLENHDKLLIAAHSMGTLFAIRQAIKHPDKVGALFLIAVPLRVHVKFRMIRTVFLTRTGRVRPDDAWTQAAVKCYGIRVESGFWKYIPWVCRYLELFREIWDMNRQLGQLQTPCLCYQSNMDELVSRKSGDILRKNKFAMVHILENSGHFYYEEKDYKRLTEDFSGFLEAHIQ